MRGKVRRTGPRGESHCGRPGDFGNRRSWELWLSRGGGGTGDDRALPHPDRHPADPAAVLAAIRVARPRCKPTRWVAREHQVLSPGAGLRQRFRKSPYGMFGRWPHLDARAIVRDTMVRERRSMSPGGPRAWSIRHRVECRGRAPEPPAKLCTAAREVRAVSCHESSLTNWVRPHHRSRRRRHGLHDPAHRHGRVLRLRRTPQSTIYAASR